MVSCSIGVQRGFLGLTSRQSKARQRAMLGFGWRACAGVCSLGIQRVTIEPGRRAASACRALEAESREPSMQF